MEKASSNPGSIEDLEAEIIRSGNKEEYYNFRSFRLVHMNGTVADWEDFRSKPLFAAFSEKLDSLPVSTVLNLCRRHPSEFPYFLDFFDKSVRMANEPKAYLPYLCQRIDTIPIQWIIQHMQIIRDVRYAHQMLGLAFAKAITVDTHQLEKQEKLNETWEKFKKITGSKNDISYNDAWLSMIDMRVAMKELIEFKLSVRLVDYNRLQKEELVTRLLGNCSNASKYIKSMETQLVSYCNATGLDIPSIVISTVSQRDWAIQQKLNVIRNFINDPEKLQLALEALKFKDDSELTEIQKFADSKSIYFNVNPGNYINAVYEATQFDQVHASSLRELANGEPSQARGYAEKLRKYKALGEIKPIFELATNYGLVVKYDEFHDVYARRGILTKLILGNDLSELENIWDIVRLSDNDLMEAILESFEDLKEPSDILMVHMVNYLKRSNVDAFLNLLEKTVKFQLERLPASQLCDLWSVSLLETLDYIDGRNVMKTTEVVRVLAAIQKSELDEDTMKELVVRFRQNQNASEFAQVLVERGLDDLAECVMPKKAADFETDTFVNSLAGSQYDAVVAALTEIAVMEKQRAIKLLVASISAIDGRNYSRLGCVFALLEERNLKYEKEFSALQILHSAELDINFHELIENPSEVLTQAVTEENIWDVLALASVLHVQTDKIILDLIDKMTSTDFDDYLKFIPELKRKNSIDPLLNGLSKKLKTSDLTRLYQAIGRIDLKHRQATINDLNSHGLGDFITDKLLNNPSSLICELYSKMSLHEVIGKRLHNLTKTLADRYELSINKIREYLVNIWLMECEQKDVTEKPSVFVETTEEVIDKDENTNIQKSLFILRSWKQRIAVKWLLRFIYQSDPVCYRAKAKAFTCLFAIADKFVIADTFTGDFAQLQKMHRDTCYFSRLEKFNVDLGVTSLTKKTVLSIINGFLPLSRDIHPGALPVLLELCLDFGIDDRDILLQLISILKVNRKRFMLTHFNSIFRTFPQFIEDEKMRESYIEVLSAPLDELIAKTEDTRPFKAHHLTIIRDLYDALVVEPFRITYWIIGGERIEWDAMVAKLCSSGFTAIAAELGAFVVDTDMRNSILFTLLSESHFDEALKFGFDQDLIFQFIVKEAIVPATEVMTDESFVMFGAWLKDHDDEESIEIVRDTLVKQGRTMELKRMNDRLAAQDKAKQTNS